MKTQCGFVGLLLGLCLFMVTGVTPASEKKSEILLESPDTLVKGFPAILRVTATGPCVIPKMSLLNELGRVSVKLTSEKGGKVFVISSNRGRELTVTTPQGIRRDSIAQKMFLTTLSEGEKRTMLIDLWSLRPEVGEGTLLNDVPVGKYSLTISFPSSGKRSNAVAVQVLNPTEDEKKFLDGIRDEGVLSRGVGVNWSKFLRDQLIFPKHNFPTLREEVRKQLQFHILLSRVLTMQPLSRQKVKTLEVPKYLSAEKECLLIEIDTITEGKRAERKRKTFLDKHPGLKWRLGKTNEAEIGDFLEHRRSGKKQE